MLNSYDVSARGRVDGNEIPVSQFKVQYHINAVPTATLHLPYGFDDSWILTGNSKFSTAHTHDAFRHLELYSTDSDRRLFNGYITDTVNATGAQYSQKGAGTKAGTVLKAKSMLALLSQSLNKPSGWSANMNSGNPYLTLDPGLFTFGWASSAASDNSLNYIIMDMMYTLADLNSGSGDIVKSVITGDSSFNWKGYKHTFQSNAELDNNFSDSYKKQTANNIVQLVQKAYKNPLQCIKTFCKVADFGLIPVVDGFYLVPLVRPAKEGNGVFGQRTFNAEKYADYYKSDYSSFKVSEQMRATTPEEPAIGTAIMMDTESAYQSPYGVPVNSTNSSDVIVGSYDLDNDTSSNYPIGETKQLSRFGWIPSGSDETQIADDLCRQYVIDSQFSSSSSIITFEKPPSSGDVDESPGSLVKVIGATADPDSKPYGDKSYYGVLKSVEYQGVVKNDSVTQQTRYILSHVMDEDLYDEIGINSHPICEGYATTLGNTLNIFYGD